MSSMKAASVSEVVGKVKSTLEGEFAQVIVEGEVSNLSMSGTGHWYFTLSDQKASLSAALFRMDAARNPLIKKLKEGDKVICVGNMSVYLKRGNFQVLVRRLTPVGKGDLKEQLELLKKRLAAEGLFDPEHKQKIPQLPQRIAIITASGSAALQDFLNILKRRTFAMDVLVSPALVQGEKSPQSLRAALHRVIKYALEGPVEKRPDVIVLARGGGSLEDLWAFNDEGLAWDIYNCPLPVISAVGHQVDYSISDFVADLRCETPSAAAEVLSEYQVQLNQRIQQNHNRLERSLIQVRERLQAKVNRIHPRTILGKIWSDLHRSQVRLNRHNLMSRAKDYTQLSEYIMRVDDASRVMHQSLKDQVQKYRHQTDKCHEILRVLDPHNVLERGYSYIQTQEGHVVASQKSFDQLESKEKLRVHFHDGEGVVIKHTD